MKRTIFSIYAWAAFSVFAFVMTVNFAFALLLKDANGLERFTTLFFFLFYAWMTLKARHWAVEALNQYAWDECPKLIAAAQESDVS